MYVFYISSIFTFNFIFSNLWNSDLGKVVKGE